MDRHTLVITAANRVGVLARVTGLLSSRGYDIETVIAAPTEVPERCEIHLVTHGRPEKIRQLVKLLRNLIDTIRVVSLSH